MAITLEIPEEAVVAMGLSQDEIRIEVKKELILALYTRGFLSVGKSAELAGMSRMDFEHLLGERQVIRPLTMEDLDHDLAWAKSETERM